MIFIYIDKKFNLFYYNKSFYLYIFGVYLLYGKFPKINSI
jgi:hypothetical protein